MFSCSWVGADRAPKQAMPVARQEDLGLCVLGCSLCRYSPFHAVKSVIVCLEEEELVFWCSLVGADRASKEAMPVAISCLEQEDLGFGDPCWDRKVIRAEKMADGRVPLPTRSGYISENRGTVPEKSRRGRVYPAVFRTRQGKSGRRPINQLCPFHAVNESAVSRFDQGIPCCDVYPKQKNRKSRDASTCLGASERHWYAIACPDKLRTDPMACGGFSK